MALNFDTIVIDRALRGTLFDIAVGDVIFTANNIQNPALEVGGELVFARDVEGAPIGAFKRSGDSTFNAESTQISLGLMAAQFGSEKEVADATNKIVARKFEQIVVGSVEGVANTKITLAEIPVGTVPFIYKLNSDKSIGTKYAVGTVASATEFAITGAEITVPTGSLATDEFAIWYNYEADEAIKIVKKEDVSVKSGRFELEVLLADKCNIATKYHAFVIFPQVVMNPGFSLNFSTEGSHPFGFTAMADYCAGGGKQSLYFIIPN